MKKAKNETAANKKEKSAAKQEKISVNDPSEKIRSKEDDLGELFFKKTLYGYDPGEVASYIKELTENNEASARNYELKLSAIKEELALSNRERDSYGEKYRECKAKLDKMPAASCEKNDAEIITAEYEKIIDALNDKLERSETENEKLRAQSVQSVTSAADDFTEKISVLENEKREAQAKIEALQRKNNELLAVNQKYEELLAEHNSLVAQLRIEEAENDTKEKEISSLKEGLAEKSEKIAELSAANDESKKKLAGLEAENGVLNQRAEENEKEILRLKDVNKHQAHEYADKINKLESEQAAGRLAMKKEIKLRDYYINQAQVTLSELSEQMEQIKKTFTDTSV